MIYLELILILVIGGLLSVFWMYVAARVVTRAVLRTIKDRRVNCGQETTQARK